MQKVNIRDVKMDPFDSPNGKFSCANQEISIALGRDAQSTDLLKRHPFDYELNHVPPGKANFPYHSHSAQWELYHVVSGTGSVRHPEGHTAIGPGDCFVFPPGVPHQIINDGGEEALVYFVIADNPVGESCHYPDSGKWSVRSPERRLIRSEALDYFDGEE